MENIPVIPRLKTAEVLIYFAFGNMMEMERIAVARAQKERNEENE